VPPGNPGNTATPAAVTALLLTSPSCVHCAALKKILEKLSQEKLIASLEIIDVAENPEVARRYGVKSVPWLQLNSLQFHGSMTEQEVRNWIGNIRLQQNSTLYLKHLLQNGELNQVLERIKNNPRTIVDLLPLIDEPELDMKVRLGISAVFEEFQGTEILKNIVEPLARLVQHESAQIRADVAHYLALTESPGALPYIKQLAEDTDREVKEIASEALEAHNRDTRESE